MKSVGPDFKIRDTQSQYKATFFPHNSHIDLHL